MKNKEINKLSNDELGNSLDKLKKDLFNLVDVKHVTRNNLNLDLSMGFLKPFLYCFKTAPSI